MTAHEHFGCRMPPFDSRPDPGVFYPGDNYEEAVATLEFAVAAEKGCCLIIGESGMGKSAIVRQVIRRLRGDANILLVHSIGQSRDELSGVAYAVDGAAPPGEQRFDEWVDYSARTARPRLLLVDDADELPAWGWRRIVAHLARANAEDHPLTIGILGLPTIRDGLSKPRLMRITRRVFRTCRLPRLSPHAVRDYIRRRLQLTGADPNRVFAADAVPMVYRMTRGVPAFINQVCDNAMLEAYSDGRNLVTTNDVAHAVYAIVGGKATVRPELNFDNQPTGSRSHRPTVRVRLPAAPAPIATANSKGLDDAANGVNSAQVQADHFDRLRAIRTRLADALNVVGTAAPAEHATVGQDEVDVVVTTAADGS